MKIRKMSVIAACSVLAIAVFFSCKKQEIISTNAQSPSNEVQAAFKQWSAQSGTISSQSKTGRQGKIDSLIAHLDYSTTAKITESNGSILFIVKVDKPSKNVNQKYLAIEQQGDILMLKGIYEAGTLEKIKQFYLAQQLAAQDSILIWNADETPSSGWIATKDGKISPRIGTWKPIAITQTKKAQSTDGVKRVNLMPAPPPDDGQCIEWYWTTYDADTHEIIDEEYVGTTGNCGGSPSTPDNPSDLSSCQAIHDQEMATFQDVVNGTMEATEEETEVSDGGGSVIEKPWSQSWTALYNAIPFNLISNEEGSLKATGYTDDTRWAFKSIRHTGHNIVGVVPICAVLTINDFAHFGDNDTTMAQRFVYAVTETLDIYIHYKFSTSCNMVRSAPDASLFDGHYTPTHIFRAPR